MNGAGQPPATPATGVPLRIMVTGSRGWTDFGTVQALLREVHERSPNVRPQLFSGHAAGLDRLAERVARDLGWPVRLFLPDWGRYGRAAGHRRNRDMVAARPDLVLAFVLPCMIDGCPRQPHGTHGTEGGIAAARRAGIPTRVVERTAPTGGRA